jgi:peptidoglycan-N-acetylglucosamine deacetylase
MKRLKFAVVLMLCALLLPASGGADIGFKSYLAGDPESKKIAITVDDMFGLDHLESILDLCQTYSIHMTFFPVGSKIKPENAELWQRVVDEGHEIGNHTFSHRNIEKLTNYQLERQLVRTQEALNAVLKEPYPLRLFRPPYGKYDRTGGGSSSALDSLGYHYIILWNVALTDADQAFKKTKNGSILLFHTNKKDVRCLEKLIPMLLDAGFEPVTVSELLGLDSAETDGE